MADLLLRYRRPAATSRIRIARRGLDRLGRFVREVTDAQAVALVTDARVRRLYGARAARSLGRAGVRVVVVALPPGEGAKSPASLAPLWEAFARAGITRRDAVVALGGGVIGDLAGFAAATWLRGVAWVAAPTTLLAQVDASVGGKTAVDLAAGKNLAGAFHQPSGVLADPDVLATLPARQIRAGLAEVVKMGVAVDATLFRWCERNADALAAGSPRALEEAVRRSVRAKARVVLADEREREGGARTALNFGHTLGHALEAALGYRRLLHGEAVALGMRAAVELSVREAGFAARDAARVDALLDRLGLPRRWPAVPPARLQRALLVDKKRASSGVRWVLTPRLGHASVPRQISGRTVRAVLDEARAGR